MLSFHNHIEIDVRSLYTSDEHFAICIQEATMTEILLLTYSILYTVYIKERPLVLYGS